jgi:hypothetical protein
VALLLVEPVALVAPGELVTQEDRVAAPIVLPVAVAVEPGAPAALAVTVRSEIPPPRAVAVERMAVVATGLRPQSGRTSAVWAAPRSQSLIRWVSLEGSAGSAAVPLHQQLMVSRVLTGQVGVAAI